jgi:beta-galactosidase
MKLGTAYYPEYNKRQEWEKDFEKIRNAGIKRVRMAEFAWSLIQPEKGVFNWDWLDESIELAEKFGIEIVLGTPTACPPVWLIEEHPDILPVNREGRRSGFGARQHRCYNTPAYIEYSATLVQAMAERYGKHPNVVAWQIDNELGGEQKKCYCDNCRKAFQEFLKEKYKTIEELNARWVNHFWSNDYQKWTQIPVPKRFAGDLLMKHHPSLELEFSRFSSHGIVKFSNLQASILRKYTEKLITTNTDTFHFGDNVNVYELFRELDIGGMDIYSDNNNEISFYSDLTRSLKSDRFWMMEYGTGSKNLQKEMEMIYERGCEWFYLFKFKPFTAGQEQSTTELITITGEPGPNYITVKNWASSHTEEFSTKVSTENNRTGIYYDFDSSWAYSFNTWSDNFEDRLVYHRYVMNVIYKGLFEEKQPVSFVFSKEGIKNVDVLILPWKILYDPGLEIALIEFVRNGGRLITTTDLFKKNEDNVYLTYLPQIYSELLGWMDKNFVNEENYTETKIITEKQTGKGRAWMIKNHLELKEWKEFIKNTLP